MMPLFPLTVRLPELFRFDLLRNFTSVSVVDALISLAISFGIGLFVYFIYKKTFAGPAYSRSFHLSLIAMCMITTLVILGVTANAVLSLGMVGALSIVRFRSAIKDPADIVFLFWTISEGILCGAGMYVLALLGAPVIGVLIWVISSRKEKTEAYLLIVRYGAEAAEAELRAAVDGAVSSCRVRSRTVSGDSGTELILEVRVPENDTGFVEALGAMQGVSYASLVSFDGNTAAE